MTKNSRLVPSIDTWMRRDFLAARAAQMDAQKAADAKAGVKGVHYMDGGDDVVCDGCNAEIDTEVIIMVNWGRRVACLDCFNKWHRGDRITFREIREDGSLGAVKDDG